VTVTNEQPVLTSSTAFVISSRSGDIHPKTRDGFYAYDTRFLSNFSILVDNKHLYSVGRDTFNSTLASFYCTAGGESSLNAAPISIVRDRRIENGIHEDIHVINHTMARKRVHIQVVVDADFADVFEVRLMKTRKEGQITVEEREGQDICLVYRRRNFRRETWITFTGKPAIAGRQALFEVELEPRKSWRTCVSIVPVVEAPPTPIPCENTYLGSPFGAYQRVVWPSITLMAKDDQRPLGEDLPRLDTDSPALRDAYQQAITDLRSLQMEYLPGHHILAAGLPWFMAVFGRDSCISAIQTKLLGPDLMRGTLYTLASLQAKRPNPFREAEPGKIPHEVRKGELSVLKRVPHSRYYGSVDSTPLFVILLWNAYQWTGDMDLLRRFLPNAEAALRWMDKYGDLDGDGFVEYKRRTRRGLRNQGWKDSGDAISFADGRLAEGPIALAEVQGNVYDAKRKMAEIYRALGRRARARRLERQAQQLKEQFNEAFWMPEHNYYAIALDGEKRQVDSVASNPGQCLWSGIVGEDKAGHVVKRLMSPDMFSGWGIRTLSTEMSRYNPLSYHNGSIWPHDNSLIAAGMARYGFHREASLIIQAMLETAGEFPLNRLPELFAGYPRRELSFPVPYPAANAPQAWASGAIVYALETLLGVLPMGDRLLQEAPREGMQFSLSGVLYRGTRRILR
jgi:glycogen debranching enzyme